MSSIRIHSSNPIHIGELPYLMLNLVGNGRISIDLAELESDPTLRQNGVVLSSEALYEVLEGKDVRVMSGASSLTFSPRREELYITCERNDGKPGSTYSVWLSEIALGWNMMRTMSDTGPRSTFKNFRPS